MLSKNIIPSAWISINKNVKYNKTIKHLPHKFQEVVLLTYFDRKAILQHSNFLPALEIKYEKRSKTK